MLYLNNKIKHLNKILNTCLRMRYIKNIVTLHPGGSCVEPECKIRLGFDYYRMSEFDYKNIDPGLYDVKTEFMNNGRENGEGNHNLS